MDLRRFVRAALNRIEAHHLLRKNIGEINGSTLRGGSDLEVDIWNECARLVANAIMYYNASLLSKLMKIKEIKGDAEGINRIAKNINNRLLKYLNYQTPVEVFTKLSKS